MRAARSRYQSYGEEVRALVVHLARIDVLSIRVHDLYAVCARASHKSIRVDLRAEGSVFFRRRMGSRRTAQSRCVAASVEMDDFIWPYGDSDCGNFLWSTTFPSSEVCARCSSGKADAILGSLPQPVGILSRSDPADRRNRLGPEPAIADRRGLDWSINDRPHAISVPGYFAPSPWRIGPGNQ